jgi:hypothetical protein
MDENMTGDGGADATLTPVQRLEMLAVGEGLMVSFELSNVYRTTASRMKMKGMKFRTKMVNGGLEVWRVK